MNPESMNKIAAEKTNLTELHQKLIAEHGKLTNALAQVVQNIQRVEGGLAVLNGLSEAKPADAGEKPKDGKASGEKRA